MEKLLVDGGIWFVVLFWQALSLTFFVDLMFNLNGSKKQKLLCPFVTSSLATILKLIIPAPASTLSSILMILIVALSFFFYYKTSILKSVLISITFTFISIPVEILGGLIAYKVMNLPAQTNNNVVSAIPLLIIINIIFSLITIFTYLYKSHLSFSKINLTDKNLNNIFINIICIVIFISPNIMFYAQNSYNYPLALLIFNILTNVLFIVLGVYNTYRNVQLETKKIELQNSELHNKNLTSLIDTIRVFKHDYNNVVHAIGGYISLNDMEGLKKYYSGLVKDSQKVNRLESITPDKINEPSIYSIMASKYQMADLKNVTFNLESMFDYKKLKMPIYDFCKILGVLLDNAIEAAEETEDKKVDVIIRESFRENVQSIVIENTYKNKDIDTNKIFEKDYSTKNRNSGLGLWEVRNIVDKNKNVNLYTSKDDKYFKQQLIINI